MANDNKDEGLTMSQLQKLRANSQKKLDRQQTAMAQTNDEIAAYDQLIKNKVTSEATKK